MWGKNPYGLVCQRVGIYPVVEDSHSRVLWKTSITEDRLVCVATDRSRLPLFCHCDPSSSL